MFCTKKKTLSLVALSIVTTVSLTACTGADVAKDTTQFINHDVEPAIIEVEENPKIISSNLQFVELLRIFYESGRTKKDILNNEEKDDLLYSAALYVNLREYGLSDETILAELKNVVTFGLVHPEADGWKNDILVKNLNNSINYVSDAIIYYYPLAKYVHEYDCDLEHTIVDGRIDCNAIEDDLMKMNESTLFANYVVENLLALPDGDPLKIALQTIINSKEDTETCILELENIYTLAIIPRGASDEEWATISHLDATLGEMENPCSYYYQLACYVHELRCFEEHYENEFGQIECKSKRKVADSMVSVGFTDYVVNEVLALDDDNSLKLALKRIMDSNEDLDTCVNELEYIYELAIIPRCASEEEWKLISHLEATVGEMENPFVVYYDLACYVHGLTCTEEHYENEFGQTECKTLRKKMDV